LNVNEFGVTVMDVGAVTVRVAVTTCGLFVAEGALTEMAHEYVAGERPAGLTEMDSGDDGVVSALVAGSTTQPQFEPRERVKPMPAVGLALVTVNAWEAGTVPLT
jgi:hypothetical protein